MNSPSMTQQTPAQLRVDRIMRGVARHWAWLLNGALLLYAGLPWLSPLLRSLGYERAGMVIFRMYRQFCHQLSERSFALDGFPVCYCHRCTALYSSLLLMSLLYTAGRWRRPIGRHMLALLTVPLIVDGTRHLVADLLPALALRSADDTVGSLNFWLRMLTATLFGVGVVLWAYPRIQREFEDVSRTITPVRGS